MLRKSKPFDKLDNTEGFNLSSHNTSDRRKLRDYQNKVTSIELDGDDPVVTGHSPTDNSHASQRKVLGLDSKDLRSKSSTSSTSNSNSSCHCLSCEDVQKELGIIRTMYMMNLDEYDSTDEKMNTTDGANHETSKGDGHTIEWAYEVQNSGDEHKDHNVILETPATNNTMNRSGTEKLYKLEEQDKKREKEEKKARKKKDKKDKKSKKLKNKKKSDEDEIIVANEEHIESGNDFPTLPISQQSNDAVQNETPYFMAASDSATNQNQFDATLVSKKDDTSKGYGSHKIPRLSTQQNFAHNTRKQDENHLIFRREDEKEDDTETTGTGEGPEQVWPTKPQRYPSPDLHYQIPYRGQPYFQNPQRPPLPLPPQNLQMQHGTLQRNDRVDPSGNANVDHGAPFYASVATLQRDRTKGMTLIRQDKDGPIFYENPYAAMPPNKTRINVQGERIVQDGTLGFEYNGIHSPPAPPPSAIYGSHYAYPPLSTKSKSKSKKKPGPPTWKEIRDAYLKSQVPEEDVVRKFSPKRHLEGLALAIGFIGLIVAVSLLLAYLIVQAPQLRRKIGPSLYIPEGEIVQYDNNDTITTTATPVSLSDNTDNKEVDLNEAVSGNRESKNLERPNDFTKLGGSNNINALADEIGSSPKKPYVIYWVEIFVSVVAGLMMIITNALLIHGVRKKYGPFLLPWLVFHAFFLAGLLTATALIINYVTPAAYKGLAALPGVAALLLILCWIKVFKLRQNFMRQQRRRCGKVDELYGTRNPSTYMNFGDSIYTPAPKIPDPDYSMG